MVGSSTPDKDMGFFFKTSRPAVRPSQYPIHGHHGAVTPGAGRPGLEDDQSSYLVPKLRMSGVVSPLPHMCFCFVRSNNFTGKYC
jgi:hypothetical protein